MEYILDGTNILLNVDQQNPSLAPVFQIMTDILERGEEAICFFDGNTLERYLEDPFEQELFKSIVTGRRGDRGGIQAPLVCEGYFMMLRRRDEEGKPIPADDDILARAREYKGARIITLDQYKDKSYKKRFNWDEKDNYERLLAPYLHQDTIRLIKGEKEVIREIPLNGIELADLSYRLINLIESRNGRLTGKIMKIDAKKQQGYIKRRYYNSRHLVFQALRNVADDSLDFIHSVGKEVRFRVNGSYQEERKKENSWKLFLFADEIQLIDSVEQDNQFLREENERLRRRIAELEAEIAELKKTTKLYIGKFQAQQEENSSLALELGSMEEQLQSYEAQLEELSFAETSEPVEMSETQSALKTLEKDYELLLDRYNRKQVQWSFISRNSGNGKSEPEDWVAAFEALSREVESLREENEQLRKLGETFISKKGIPLGDTPTQPVYPQPAGMDKDPLLNWWHSLADDWRKAYAYIHDMNVDSPNLIVLEQILMGNELTLIGHHTMIPRSLPFKLQDMTGLSSLQELQSLNLSYNQIEDTHGLRHLTQLETLVLIGNPLQTLQGLAQLPLLQKLKIMQCGVSPAEIEWLQSKKPELEIETD